VTRSAIAMVLAASLAAAGGQLLFKVGAQHRTHFLQFANLPIAIGLVLYALGTVLWIAALSREKLLLVYAFTGLTFVLVYLGGTLLLGEPFTPKAACGAGLILGGLYLIVA
jgi:drug/metabolite transporter (DMT)-like permease